jgi:hypothetical protein
MEETEISITLFYLRIRALASTLPSVLEDESASDMIHAMYLELIDKVKAFASHNSPNSSFFKDQEELRTILESFK